METGKENVCSENIAVTICSRDHRCSVFNKLESQVSTFLELKSTSENLKIGTEIAIKIQAICMFSLPELSEVLSWE